MKFLNLFSGENKKDISLSSAEYTQRVVKVKGNSLYKSRVSCGSLFKSRIADDLKMTCYTV